MSKMIQRAVGIGALVLGLSGLVAGCGTPADYGVTDVPSDDSVQRTTISGYPISVAHVGGDLNSSLATFIRRDTGDPVLASRSCYSLSDHPLFCTEAAALIQSEIDDGDNEKAELSGYFNDDDRFVIEAVMANGETVSF